MNETLLPLSTHPRQHPHEPDVVDMVFGNTGFEVDYNFRKWSWNFMPEGKFLPKEIPDADKIKYARMFVCGFGSFLSWLESDFFENAQLNRPKSIRAETNTDMKNMLISFLGEDVLEITQTDENKFEVKINLELVVEDERILGLIKSFQEFEKSNHPTLVKQKKSFL